MFKETSESYLYHTIQYPEIQYPETVQPYC